MFYPMNFLLVCTHMGFVAQTVTLGNVFNLHKSKMNSGRHFDNFTCELLVLECCVIPLFWGSKVRRIHLCCYFLQIKVMFKVKSEISVDNQWKLLLNVISVCMFSYVWTYNHILIILLHNWEKNQIIFAAKLIICINTIWRTKFQCCWASIILNCQVFYAIILLAVQ